MRWIIKARLFQTDFVFRNIVVKFICINFAFERAQGYRLSDSLVEFRKLKPHFLSEFAKARQFQNFSLVSCNVVRTLCSFPYSFWLVKPIERNILLNISYSEKVFSDMIWNCTFQQPFWSSALRIAFNFPRRWLFCSPELEYQTLLCRSSTALSALFCTARNFQENFPVS